MKLTADRKKLIEALTILNKVSDPKTSMPILKCVRIDAGVGVTLDATDLTTFARASFVAPSVTVEARGSVCVDVRQLLAILKGAANASATLEMRGNRLHIASATMETLAAQYFPKMAIGGDTAPWIDAATCARMLAVVLPAVSTDITRYHLNGVFVETDTAAMRLRMVATDGHRLMLQDRAGVIFPKSSNAQATGTLPRGAALVLAQACKRAASLRCGMAEGHFTAEVDAMRLVVKLVDGAFPPYAQVIPSHDDGRTLSVNRAQLADTLRQAKGAASGKDHAVVLGMRRHTLRVTRYDSEGARAFRADLPASYAGPSESFLFTVNPSYLTDAIATFEGEETAVLSLGGEIDPVKMTSADGRTVAVIMPVRGDAAAGDLPEALDAATVAAETVEAPAPKTRAARRAKGAGGIKISIERDDGTMAPIAAEPDAAQAPTSAAPPVEPPAPALADLVAEGDPTHLLAATVEVARGIVEAFQALATMRARACYRCRHVSPMGYVLDGKVCCRDCREAHRVDYYASRGQEARPRQRRGGGYGGSVSALHVTAEHVTIAQV